MNPAKKKKNQTVFPVKPSLSDEDGEETASDERTQEEEEQEPEEEPIPEEEQIQENGQEEIYIKEEAYVALQSLEAEPEEMKEKEQMKKKEIFKPVVKVITFTISSVVLVTGLVYLFFLMFRSIRVYHYDGEGRPCYGGSCILHRKGDGFEVKIPSVILDQSSTGEYVLKPGKWFVKTGKGRELIVLAGGRKETLWIAEEMPLRLPAFE